MFLEGRSADPAVHELCIRIARRCVGVIEPMLRQEEIREALYEMYRAARLEIEKPTPPSQET